MKGAALPKMSSGVGQSTATEWLAVKVRWYDGREQTLQMVSGTGVWYRTGLPALPLRWVLTRDPAGNSDPKPISRPTPKRKQ